MRCVLFSSNLRVPTGFGRSTYLAGHAMLTLLQPGDHWPVMAGSIVPVELSHVHVSARFRSAGYGGQLARQAIGYATRRRWPIALRVTPYGRGSTALNEDQLVAWYAKLGFRLLDRDGGISYMALDYRR